MPVSTKNHQIWAYCKISWNQSGSQPNIQTSHRTPVEQYLICCRPVEQYIEQYLLSLVKRLAGTKWGASRALRISTLTLVYAPTECCAPVCCRSSHSHKVDMVLNEVLRTIAGYLKRTPLSYLPFLAGISPPKLRLDTVIKQQRLYGIHQIKWNTPDLLWIDSKHHQHDPLQSWQPLPYVLQLGQFVQHKLPATASCPFKTCIFTAIAQQLFMVSSTLSGHLP